MGWIQNSLIQNCLFVFLALAFLGEESGLCFWMEKRGPWNPSERQRSMLTNWLFLWRGFWIDPWRRLGHYLSHYQSKEPGKVPCCTVLDGALWSIKEAHYEWPGSFSFLLFPSVGFQHQMLFIHIAADTNPLAERGEQLVKCILNEIVSKITVDV